jgi:hypothetical protein
MAEAYRWRSRGRLNQAGAAAVCRHVTTRRVLSSLVAVALIVAAGLVQAQVAPASFHLVQIREVFPGTILKPGAEYIELQMWASGQNLIQDHKVRVFDGDGRPVAGGDLSFPANVPNGANQSTFILATPEAETLFRFKADAPMGDRLLEDGGAVCWGPELDCVSWGRFPANTALTSPAGTPAGVIPDGMALQRSIASGCPTLLESGDDHNNSATDFVFAPPSPRPNSVLPTERECIVAAPPASAPKTSLRKKPAKRTRDHTPTFRFSADQAGSTFQCKVDKKPFRTCRSPYTTKPLKPGKHSFKVRAVSAQGLSDTSPAAFTFTILGKKR